MFKINRNTILKAIKDELLSAKQWSVNGLEFKLFHRYKAESLIELLEINDCGSTGGFDQNNPLRTDTQDLLYNRYLTLKYKK